MNGKGGALTVHYQTLEQLAALIAKLGWPAYSAMAPARLGSKPAGHTVSAS